MTDNATPPTPPDAGDPPPPPDEPQAKALAESAPEAAAGGPSAQALPATPYRPSYVFLAVVAVASLALDLGTKMWVKNRLEDPTRSRHIEIIPDHISFVLASNKGGAW